MITARDDILPCYRHAIAGWLLNMHNFRNKLNYKVEIHITSLTKNLFYFIHNSDFMGVEYALYLNHQFYLDYVNQYKLTNCHN